MLTWLLSLLFGNRPPMLMEGRSPQWATCRARHLKTQPVCQVCGTKTALAVHHIQPVHTNPELELDETNLITLCQGVDGGCHFRWGHLWNWTSWNDKVEEDASEWRVKIEARP